MINFLIAVLCVASVCAENDSLYQEWLDAMYQVNSAQIEVDQIVDKLHTAQVTYWAVQSAVITHLQGHAECNENCEMLVSLLQDLKMWGHTIVDIQNLYSVALYVRDSAVATEQTRWWAIVTHFNWCPKCK